MEKLTDLADFFRKIPAAFLVAIISVLVLVLFLPESVSQKLALDSFRESYKQYLGPAFLLTISFSIARIFLYFKGKYEYKKSIKNQELVMHELTAEEKGYLVVYIEQQKNTIYVGIDDGIMGGLVAKKIVYRASSNANLLQGFPYNLQPWARKYLEKNTNLLNGYAGRPMTPREKLHI